MKAWTCSQGSELGSALRKGQVLMPTPGGSRVGGYLREVLESFRASTPDSDGSLLPLRCSVVLVRRYYWPIARAWLLSTGLSHLCPSWKIAKVHM